MSSPPMKKGHIMISPEQFCDKHLDELEEYNIPFLNIFHPVLNIILEDRVFYETCYRIRNGYGMPEGMTRDDIPDSEKPEVSHINEAIEEFEPLCCYIAEQRDSETEMSNFIEAIAEKAAELRDE